jgi:uncharacterized protein
LAIEYLIAFRDYLIEILPFLAAGLLLSGLIHEFIPSAWVERHLGGRGIKPLLYCTFAGTFIPLCCFGSIPVAVSLYRKGAGLGPVLAFLVATPATSATSLLVSYRLLGWRFVVYEYLSVIAIGLVMGLIGNAMKSGVGTLVCQGQEAVDPVCGMNVEVGSATEAGYRGQTYYFCCSHCREAFEGDPERYAGNPSRQVAHRMRHLLRYAFVDMLRDIGPWLLLGVALAALVAAVAPVGDFVGTYLGGGYGYLFSLGFGLAMYICSTGSVPLVHALLSQGMNIGAGMVILLVGPVTSWGTILVLRKEFGGKIMAIYLGVVSVMALLLGYGFSLI